MSKFFTYKRFEFTDMIRKADIKCIFFDDDDMEIEITMKDDVKYVVYCDHLSKRAWHWKKLCYRFRLSF